GTPSRVPVPVRVFGGERIRARRTSLLNKSGPPPKQSTTCSSALNRRADKDRVWLLAPSAHSSPGSNLGIGFPGRPASATNYLPPGNHLRPRAWTAGRSQRSEVV